MHKAWNFVSCCAALLAITGVANAEIVIDLRAGANGGIQLSGNGEQVVALNLTSKGGNLTTISKSPAPFDAQIDTLMPEQIAYAVFGGEFSLNGTYELSVGYDQSLIDNWPEDFDFQWNSTDLDEVTSVVPEPSTGILAALAGLTLFGVRRRLR